MDVLIDGLDKIMDKTEDGNRGREDKMTVIGGY